MTDRELLELAAKAAGYKKYYLEHMGRKNFVTIHEKFFNDDWGRGGTSITTMDWNPLHDDGDALRLAVKLGIQIQIYLPTDRERGQTSTYSQTLLGYGITNFPSYQAGKIFSEDYNGDPCAATRRAIVRAAAEIGKQMK